MIDLNALKNNCSNLHALLLAENEKKWAGEIIKFVELLEAVEKRELTIEEAMPMMQKKYKSMHHPHGGFGEIHFWRDNFDERKKLNEQFSHNANAIWDELNN